jgi:hypothetical protein
MAFRNTSPPSEKTSALSDADCTALVKVKGYSGAAKSNDLDQIKRVASSFAREEGRDPNALWYVPNLRRDIDPGQRSLALEGREDDLTSFADLFQGCLIDTRDLFALRQQAALERLSAVDAREQLKRASRRYVVQMTRPGSLHSGRHRCRKSLRHP